MADNLSEAAASEPLRRCQEYDPAVCTLFAVLPEGEHVPVVLLDGVGPLCKWHYDQVMEAPRRAWARDRAARLERHHPAPSRELIKAVRDTMDEITDRQYVWRSALALERLGIDPVPLVNRIIQRLRSHSSASSGARLPGGRPTGWRKGQVWPARENAAWWLAWDLDDDPKPEDYAAAIGAIDPATALSRWRESGLDWPPTTAQFDEFGDE